MQQPQIDLTQSTAVEGFNGEQLFAQGFVIRKISKFILGSEEDGIIPVQIFYDLDSKKILLESLPKEIRKEYEHIGI